MARIQPVDPAQAPDEVREALENLPPLNIFRTLAHAETAFRPFLRFGGAVLGQMSLDPVVRELAILTVAKEAEAEYEWVQHVAIAKAVGATDEQIAALAEADSCAPEGADARIARAAARDGSGGDGSGGDISAGNASGGTASGGNASAGTASAGDAGPFDGAQQAAIELAAAVVHGPHISGDLWDCVRAQFSDREIVELLLAIGDYLMLARLMTVLELDVDEALGEDVLRGAQRRRR